MFRSIYLLFSMPGESIRATYVTIWTYHLGYISTNAMTLFISDLPCLKETVQRKNGFCFLDFGGCKKSH